MIRRGIAFLLLFSFSMFSVELAVADVHDGDASAEELATLGAQDLNQSSVPEAEASQRQSPVSGGENAPSQPTHATHACHCVHAHGSMTSDATALPGPAVLSKTTLALDVLLPAAVHMDVHVRPPIVSAQA